MRQNQSNDCSVTVAASKALFCWSKEDDKKKMRMSCRPWVLHIVLKINQLSSLMNNFCTVKCYGIMDRTDRQTYGWSTRTCSNISFSQNFSYYI